MIKIQSEQWECNREQFQSLQTTVKSTVQETMQSEMKSYSSDLTEKPSFLALRVGKKSASKARPVKVTLTGNGSVNQILMNNLNNRTRYRTGICIITGHIGLNKHLHRINRSDTSNSPNCTDTEETVAHYISQCPANSRIRGDTLGTYYDSINNIMDNNNIDLIINFALKTKRLLKKEEKDDTGVT